MNDLRYMTRYLLGELSEEEQAALEEQYVAEPRIFDEIVRAESDLVDDYVRGKLPRDARERFERVYLAHPQRRERVKFAQALVTRLDRPEDFEAAAAPVVAARFASRTWRDALLRPKPALGFAFATLLIAAGVWMMVEVRRARQEAGRNTSASAGQTPTARPDAPRSPIIAMLTLDVGSDVRAADTSGPTSLVIPASATEVRLQLRLRELESPTYRMIVRRAGGAEIVRREPLTATAGASAAIITLSVPADQFESGDYIVTLQGESRGGFEDLSRSLVRVDKR